MTKIIVNNIQARSASSVEFKDVISVNGANQWADTYGIIKLNKNTIDDSSTIPVSTNAITAGSVTISVGSSVTVLGEWTII